MNIIQNINHVWMFFTDRCNLGCGYCFYKYRTQKQVMTLKTFENIINFIKPIIPAEFVFSGGEPLMDIERLKAMITIVKKNRLSRYLSVQTNATLLDEKVMDFFLQHGVNLEVGIDGDEITTQRNRPGIGNFNYKDIIRGVNLVTQKRGSFTTTMVVHPSGVSKLFDNLKYLASKGLKSIEVHPAFLENWNEESSAVFLDQYRKACAWELKERKKGLIGRGYSEPSRGYWDLLSMPNGKVLANWLLLSFPEEVKKHLYLMDFRESSSGEFLPQANSYFQALEGHIRKNPNSSYRSISNFNAIYATQTPEGEKYKKRVEDYVELCECIEGVDCKVMKVEKT